MLARLSYATGLFIFTLSLFAGSFAQSETLKVKLKDGIPRVVDWTPGNPALPPVVLVNGLVYNYSRWNPLAEVLAEKGYPILRYYFRGQHNTLLAELKQDSYPKFFTDGLTSEQMGDELSEILTTLKITQPVVVVGLSYGAHIAAQLAERHPKQVKQLVLLAPLVKSLDKYDSQGAFLNWNLEQIRFWWGPFLGPAFYEYAYGFIYRGYLSQRVVPERVPSELQDYPNEYRESLFHLVRAVRDFDLTDKKFAKLPARSVTYIVAQEPTAQVFVDQVTAAKTLKKKALQSLIYLPESTHAVPDTNGPEAALIIDRIIQRENSLTAGESWVLRQGQLVPWNEKQ